jgi:L-amino acid N-acyltransferase YncA
MGGTIRFAEPRDAAAIQTIYAPNVEEAAISFELRSPSVAEMADRMAKITAQYPWLVAENSGAVAGYVYACQHRERAAYRWAVDVTVYVDAAHRRKNVGRGLYTSLLSLLKLQNYSQAFAGITLPNPGSVGVHESVGFKPLVVFPQIGFKLGEWRDVGWWQIALQSFPGEPPEPCSIAELRQSRSTDVGAALTEGEKLLRF